MFLASLKERIKFASAGVSSLKAPVRGEDTGPTAEYDVPGWDWDPASVAVCRSPSRPIVLTWGEPEDEAKFGVARRLAITGLATILGAAEGAFTNDSRTFVLAIRRPMATSAISKSDRSSVLIT